MNSSWLYAVLLLHLTGAAIWTGGHLVLAVSVLPKALRQKKIQELKSFEQNFERIGIPALITQVITGLLLAHSVLPDFSTWFDFSTPISRVVGCKLILLGLTLGLAIDARLRVIPKLSEKNLVPLAWHIIPVTIISVLFMALGLSVRFGGIH